MVRGLEGLEMRKRLFAVLIVALLIFPQGALADNVNIQRLEFNKLNSTMRAFNPTILVLNKSFTNVSNALDDTQIKAMQNLTVSQLLQVNATLGGATIVNTNPGFTVTDPVRSRYIVYDSVNQVYLFYLAGTWTIITQASVVTAPGYTGNMADDASRNMDYQNYLLVQHYQNQLQSVTSSLASLTAQKDSLWKSAIQLEQNTNRVITMAESAYLGYFALLQSRDKYVNNLAILQSNLAVMTLRQSLGIGTKAETAEAQTQVREMSAVVKAYNNQLTITKSQLNMMLGQDISTEITLTEPEAPEGSLLDSINYDSDQKNALTLSYNVQLATGDAIQIEDAKRSFTLAFKNTYVDIQNKREALSLQQEKLANEKVKYNLMSLKYSFGMISRMTLDNERYAYLAQQDVVKSAERDLLQSYTTYNWLKKGYQQ